MYCGEYYVGDILIKIILQYRANVAPCPIAIAIAVSRRVGNSLYDVRALYKFNIHYVSVYMGNDNRPIMNTHCV